MTIAFSEIPSNLRVPLFYAEITGSASSSATQRSLLIGQLTSAGTATANTPIAVTSFGQSRTLFGEGSQLSLMVQKYLANDPYGVLYCLPVADNGSGTAQAYTITVGTATAATEAGTFYVYAAGRRVAVSVASGDEDSDVAIAIKAALDAESDLPFTTAITDDTDDNLVVLTCRNKGASAGDWTVGINDGGVAAGESLPAGVVITSVSSTATGATEPTLTTAITNMADDPYDFIGFPYTDSTNLAAMVAEISRRWGATVQTYGMVFTAARGAQSTITTLAGNYDEKGLTILGFDGARCADYERAAAYCGASALQLKNHPARPLTTVPLKGVDVTPEASVYTLAERNLMANNGAAWAAPGSTRKYDRIGVPVATYLTNADGASSTTFWRIERTATAMRYVRRIKSKIEATFARALLVANGTPVAAGIPAATPNAIKQVIVSETEASVLDGWIQGLANFASSILVEINDSSPGRVDVYCTPELADQLTVVATRMEFQG